MRIFDYIHIDEDSRVPKYKQIVDSIIDNISNGKLKMDDKIPSINVFSEEYLLSRDTVEKAYNILKNRKIIVSIRGKGFYIARTKLISKINVVFFINKLSSYKMMIYNSFIGTIGGKAHTDLQIYHCDESLLLSLMERNSKAYDFYIIMPHFKNENSGHTSSTPGIINAMRQIPRDRLMILDNKIPELSDIKYEVYQDFERDIFRALKEGLPKIKKYKRLIMSFPSRSVYPYPKGILFGFQKFCVEQEMEFEVIEEVFDDMILKHGDLFITISESDLVSLINQIHSQEFKLGDEIGVISYNDTPLKQLLGIACISTDFTKMGETAARMILERNAGQVRNPFNFIDRESV